MFLQKGWAEARGRSLEPPREETEAGEAALRDREVREEGGEERAKQCSISAVSEGKAPGKEGAEVTEITKLKDAEVSWRKPGE